MRRDTEALTADVLAHSLSLFLSFFLSLSLTLSFFLSPSLALPRALSMPPSFHRVRSLSLSLSLITLSHPLQTVVTIKR